MCYEWMFSPYQRTVCTCQVCGVDVQSLSAYCVYMSGVWSGCSVLISVLCVHVRCVEWMFSPYQRTVCTCQVCGVDVQSLSAYCVYMSGVWSGCSVLISVLRVHVRCVVTYAHSVLSGII